MQRKIALATAAEKTLHDAMHLSPTSHLPPPPSRLQPPSVLSSVANINAPGGLLPGLPLRAVWAPRECHVTASGSTANASVAVPRHGTSAVCDDASPLLVRVVRVSQRRHGQQLTVHVTVRSLNDTACRLAVSVVPRTGGSGSLVQFAGRVGASSARGPMASTCSYATVVPPHGTRVVTAVAEILPLECALETVRYTVMLHHQVLIVSDGTASSVKIADISTIKNADRVVTLGTGIAGPHLQLAPHTTHVQCSTHTPGFATHLLKQDAEHDTPSMVIRCELHHCCLSREVRTE